MDKRPSIVHTTAPKDVPSFQTFQRNNLFRLVFSEKRNKTYASGVGWGGRASSERDVFRCITKSYGALPVGRHEREDAERWQPTHCRGGVSESSKQMIVFR